MAALDAQPIPQVNDEWLLFSSPSCLRVKANRSPSDRGALPRPAQQVENTLMNAKLKTACWSAALTLPLMAVSMPASAVLALGGATGAYASATTNNNCPSYCTGSEFVSVSDGGESFSSATMSESTYGSAMASVSLSPTANALPEHHVYASSGLGKGSSGYTMAAQGYTYTGTGTTTVVINFLVDGSTSDNASGYAFNKIGAGAALFLGAGPSWYSDFGTMVYEDPGGAFPDTTWSDSMQGGSSTPLTGQFSFSIAANETFYVVTELYAHGYNGTADAWNTMHVTFEDSTNLVAMAAPVPEPGALWLLLGGLPLLAVARRRSQRSAQRAQ
jgi:hypothetical protein